MNKSKGACAAGHQATAQAAIDILQGGGNAFDAAVAAAFAACVAEPALASIGGGGYVLVRPQSGPAIVYDAFVQTPKCKTPNAEFFPILADFGATTQEFHIGWGSVATPGVVKGLFELHADLCTMPMSELIAPALKLSRQGISISHFQSYVFSIIQPIFEACEEAFAVFRSPANPHELLQADDVLVQDDLANTLEALAFEGERLFYQGEIAAALAQHSHAHAGHLSIDDLQSYRVQKNAPLSNRFYGWEILSNPPPSAGGWLIAYSLALLENHHVEGLSADQFATHFVDVLAETNRIRRVVESTPECLTKNRWSGLLQSLLPESAQKLEQVALCRRGTTHLSVVDHIGNAVSLSLSNGEGCGRMLPGWGFMPNNMLGEEDLVPQGFHLWPSDQRMASMMAPSIASNADTTLVLGSGGSNRIRSAILQTLVQRIVFDRSIEEAVKTPRLHLEGNKLSIEGGVAPAVVRALCEAYSENHIWDDTNIFFGGVHAVEWDHLVNGFAGLGDPRREGCFLIAD